MPEEVQALCGGLVVLWAAAVWLEWLRRGELDWFGPPFLLGTLFVWNTAGGALSYYAFGDWEWFTAPELIPEALLYGVGCFAALWLGYFCWPVGRRRLQVYRCESPTELSRALLLAGLAAAFIYISGEGGIGYLWRSTGGLRVGPEGKLGDDEAPIFNSLIRGSTQLLNGLPALAVVYLGRRVKSVAAVPMAGWLALAVVLLVSLAYMLRGPVFITVGCTLAALHYRGNKLRFQHMVVVVVVALAFYHVQALVRNVADVGVVHSLSAMREYSDTIWDSAESVCRTSVAGANLKLVTSAMSLSPRCRAHDAGLGIVAQLSPLPYALSGPLQEYTYGYSAWFKQSLIGEAACGIPSPFLCDTWISLGWWGLLVWLALGCELSFVYHRMLGDPNRRHPAGTSLWLFVYSLQVGGMFVMWHSGTRALARLVLNGLLLGWIVRRRFCTPVQEESGSRLQRKKMQAPAARTALAC